MEVEDGEAMGEERDLSHIAALLDQDELLTPEEQEKRMRAEGWVPASEAAYRGPPQRPVPMPPSRSISGMYDKIEYDASHMYQDLLVKQEDVAEEEDKIEVDLKDKPVGNKYEVTGELGRGATALVKVAKDKQNGTLVAIKCINTITNSFAHFSSSWKKTAQFLNLCASVPSVIKLIESFEGEDEVFLVLELCHGTLIHTLQQSQIEWSQKSTVSVLRQILEAVKFIHSQNITHGDLAPGNILSLDSTAKIIKISGFTKVTSEENDNDLFTEPRFKAPEVVNKAIHGKPVDIWAIGCFSYLLLSGTLPFEDSNIMKLYSIIKEAKVTFPQNNWASINSDAQDFIAHLLNKDPNARLTAEQALQHPWILSGGSDTLINIQDRLNSTTNKSLNCL